MKCKIFSGSTFYTFFGRRGGGCKGNRGVRWWGREEREQGGEHGGRWGGAGEKYPSE